ITAAQWAAVESSLVGGRGAAALAGGGTIAGMVDGPSGDRYAYGHFAGTLNVGGTVLSSGTTEGDRVGFVVRIDPVGRIAWAKAFAAVNHWGNSQQNEELVQIAGAGVDASGNAIVAGTYRILGVADGVDFAGQTNQPCNDVGGFVVSLRRDGTPAWFYNSNDGGVRAMAMCGGGGDPLACFGDQYLGCVRLLSAADGSVLQSWPTVVGAVAKACFSGASPVLAFEGGNVTKLGSSGTAWDWAGDGGAITKIFGTPSGDVVVFRAGHEAGAGGVTLLASSDGSAQWSEAGFSTGTGWDEQIWVGEDEYGPIYETQYYESSCWHNLRDVAADRAGNVWLDWDSGDSGSAHGPANNYSYSNHSYHVGRRGEDAVDLGNPFLLSADAAGDIHAMGYVDGAVRDVRFDGQSGAQEADSRVEGASGSLLAASHDAACSLVIAGAGGIARSSGWAVSASVDGVVSAESGIILGDGTLVDSADDIAALGPVQSGGGGTYFVMGSVGIGTDAPAYGLDVAGNARVTGPMTLGGALSVGGALSAAAGSVSGDLAVAGSLTVTNDCKVLGTSDLARVPAKGDIPMGAFTNGPAQ
ncbi:MAG: hypothetical protein IT195_00520, partial [Microthrixaceae bacterium]|nr:hypothetical protein [Microthrixaceae bacterium]